MNHRQSGDAGDAASAGFGMRVGMQMPFDSVLVAGSFALEPECSTGEGNDVIAFEPTDVRVAGFPPGGESNLGQ